MVLLIYGLNQILSKQNWKNYIKALTDENICCIHWILKLKQCQNIISVNLTDISVQFNASFRKQNEIVNGYYRMLVELTFLRIFLILQI